ncbi:hornerin-like [Diachasma alloeum]|uniref:hornerin-like n=1 Tax=Diachasma alloeum TaxID=454923 RepID=UPI0010FB3BF1|nr:hornerin-like [Diachasma alloeum]
MWSVMARCRVVVFLLIFTGLRAAEDRVYFNDEAERRWNTPPELTPEAASPKNGNSPQPRFLPFSASFSLSAGGSNAHSLSVGGTKDSISLSQSQSSSSGSFGNAGSGISASQSSSFSAGLSGISASDANAFNLNHPAFGGHSQADSNSFALGQASAGAHGSVVNNQANSEAHSSVGNAHSSAASGASSVVGNGAEFGADGAKRGQSDRGGKPSWTNIGPNYDIGGLYTPSTDDPVLKIHARPQYTPPLRLHVGISNDRFTSQRPSLLITQNRPPTRHYRPFRASRPQVKFPNRRDRWAQDPLAGPSPQEWSQNHEFNPSLQISAASASSSASSNSPNGFSLGQSSSHSQTGSTGPSSWSTNYVESSGNAQGHAQGTAASVDQNSGGQTQASFSSGTISAASVGNGHSQGISLSGNRGQNSRGQVHSQSAGTASAHGTANAGSVSFMKFPSGDQNIPREFVRNDSGSSRDQQRRRMESNRRNPIDQFFTDITDTVSDIFDI